MLGWLLAACDPGGSDGPRIVGTRPAEDEVEAPGGAKPFDPAGGTTSTPAPPVDDECTPAPPTGAADDLALSFCRRVSPEGPAACGTYRCTLYNLLGAVGLVGTPTEPVLQYCDSDPDGGLRVGVYDPALDEMLAPALLPWRTCESSWGNGTLATGADGALEAFWSTYEIEDGGASFTYVLWTATYDAAADAFGEPRLVEGAPEPQYVERASGGPSVLFLVTPGGALSSFPVGGGGATTLGSSDGRITAAATADEAIVAACDGGAVRLHAVDAIGAETWERAVASSTCLEGLAPGVAVADDGSLAVAWAEGGISRVAVLAPDGTELGRVDLGGGTPAAGPAIAAAAGHFLVVDALGAGAVLDATGAVVRTFHHPGIALRPVENRELRVLWDGADAAFALAMEFTVVAGPHVSTHDEIEVSGAPIGVTP